VDNASLGRSAGDDAFAITQQIYNYCRAVDRLDVELGYSIWHEDGIADYGEAIFCGTGRGLIEFVLESHRALLGHSHQITNTIINLDGDRAASESYVTAVLRFPDEDGVKQLALCGRYLDRWSFRSERWAIDERIYAHDFDDMRRIEAILYPGTSQRDRSDISYPVLNLER
jgi:hypothetical protein